LTGVELTECILQMFRPIGNVDLSKSGQYFLQITLSKAYASKYELKGESGDDLPTEDIEIVYEKLLFEYKEFDSATSVMGSPLKAGWDWDLKAAAS
jgi:type VI protein secretion system component Hcp